MPAPPQLTGRSEPQPKKPPSLSKRSSWVRHVLGLDEGVEFFGGDVAEFEGGFAEADVGVVGSFGDLSSLVIADFRNESGDEHQGIVDVVFDLRAIDFDPLDAVGYETVASAGEEFDG